MLSMASVNISKIQTVQDDELYKAILLDNDMDKLLFYMNLKINLKL